MFFFFMWIVIIYISIVSLCSFGNYNSFIVKFYIRYNRLINIFKRKIIFGVNLNILCFFKFVGEIFISLYILRNCCEIFLVFVFNYLNFWSFFISFKFFFGWRYVVGFGWC